MGERFGVLIAIVSSCLGGTAAAVTRYLSGNADPLTLAILRWGIGIVCVLPIALIMRVRWPRRYDVCMAFYNVWSRPSDRESPGYGATRPSELR